MVSINNVSDPGTQKRKIALVTGGAVRLGQAICRELQPKYRIAIHCCRSVEAAHALLRDISEARIFAMDLTRPGAPGRLIEEVISQMGQLDILINNAGLFSPDKADLLDLAKMKVLNTDVPTQLMTAALPHLTETGGAIVNIADIAGIMPLSTYRAYSTSRSTLIRNGTRMALHAARKGVRINTVCPGIVLPQVTMDSETRHNLIRRIPLGRFGTPNDVAKLVAFLCESDFITGQVITVDGGRLLQYAEDAEHSLHEMELSDTRTKPIEH